VKKKTGISSCEIAKFIAVCDVTEPMSSQSESSTLKNWPTRMLELLHRSVDCVLLSKFRTQK